MEWSLKADIKTIIPTDVCKHSNCSKRHTCDVSETQMAKKIFLIPKSEYLNIIIFVTVIIVIITYCQINMYILIIKIVCSESTHFHNLKPYRYRSSHRFLALLSSGILYGRWTWCKLRHILHFPGQGHTHRAGEADSESGKLIRHLKFIRNIFSRYSKSCKSRINIKV